MKKQNLIGQKFERLLVVEQIDKTYYKCKCDCGNEKVVRKSNLLSRGTRSCGCLMKDSKKRHGLRYSEKRLYYIHQNMKQRCNNPNHRDYKNYGGRGITVCPEWKDFVEFYDWAKQNGYSPELSIDRIDNDKGYSIENCRWADKKTQGNNRSNIKCEIEGQEITLMEIADKYEKKYSTISSRYKRGKRGLDLIA